MSGSVHIGTSGWHFKHWTGAFYPTHLNAKERLAYYAGSLNSVEINHTFYSLPTETTVDAWRETVTAGFTFAVKASRYVTHMKKLKDPAPGLERLLASVEPLGKALGPILFQLPPRWNVNTARLESFLQELPRDHDFAFEFRDPSWHTEEVYETLRRFNAAFCIFEIAGQKSPLIHTADLTYVRLHGPTKEAYRGNYSRAKLRAWADRVHDWRGELRAIYFYFDNDENAYAIKNAVDLRGMVE